MRNQVRYEIDARFIRHDIARHKAAGHPQVGKSDSSFPLLVIVIAHQILSYVLHIVHVNAHIVSQSVRHKQPSDTVCGHLGGISVHYSQALEPLKHTGDRRDVDLTVADARTDHRECELIALMHNVINLTLLGCELAGTRIGAGEIRGIMGVAFRSGIHEQEPSRSDDLVVAVVVKGLAVLRQDGREGNSPALGKGYTVHTAHDALLKHPGHTAFPGCGVHTYAQVATLVDFLNLTFLFHQTHPYHSPCKGLRGHF